MIRRFAAFAFLLALIVPGSAQEAGWKHGLAMMGEPKYPAGFQHFDYVKPDAPKGGLVRFGAQGTFDSFNMAIGAVKGEVAAGLGLVYESLATSSLDEVMTEYGLLADAIRHPEDFSSVTYRLNEKARWHDGKPVTPDDVIFSLETFKKHSPMHAFYYKNVTKAEKTGEREVTFTFDEKGNRELPIIVGQLQILPKHWWEGTAPDGRKRDVSQTTLEPPLGSGPYKVKSFDPGRTVAYERVPDYWGKDLPTMRGTNNFDEIRYEYYRDATVLLEAFKGDRFDFRSENIARNWAQAYDFPAVRDGRVIKEEFPDRDSGIMQAFVLNLRRDKFKDERVRRAFNLAFDFEETNRTLFVGLYKRVDSFFFGTELASSGLPEGQELAILETVRDKIPAAVFTTAYKNPVNGSPENVRNNLREAVRLLQEAGYESRSGRLVNKATGEPFTAEFLAYDATHERYALVYRQALERIGIQLSVRIVDPAQYQNRIRAFDFDISTGVWGQSLSPGNEQRDQWGSEAADRPGSRNMAGIKNPAVDALIEKIIFAKDRPELLAATKALDRVLLHNNYVVPQWSSGVTRTARWNRFSRPEKLPEYAAPAFPSIWWYDQALAQKTGIAR